MKKVLLLLSFGALVAIGSLISTSSAHATEAGCTPLNREGVLAEHHDGDGNLVLYRLASVGTFQEVGTRVVGADFMLITFGQNVPVAEGEIILAQTLCGGTSNCSSKVCQGNSRCVEGMRGCFCQ